MRLHPVHDDAVFNSGRNRAPVRHLYGYLRHRHLQTNQFIGGSHNHNRPYYPLGVSYCPRYITDVSVWHRHHSHCPVGTRHTAMSKKAVFVGGQLFWDMFLAYRILWLMGRFGAGKTALSVIMAARLLAEKRVRDVVSNIPMSFSSPVTAEMAAEIVIDKKPVRDLGIVLDEAWIYIDDRKSVFEYAGFVRKFEHYLLLPSVFPIHPRLSFFYVQRVFNAYTLGLPLWVYRWSINNRGVKADGSFGIWNPDAVFGHYPSDFVPGDDGNIADMVALSSAAAGFKGTRSESLRKKKGKKDEENDGDFEADFHSDVQAIEDATADFAQTRDDMAKIAKAIRRSR